MKIGIIGAGFVGRSIAKLALQAGHDVMLSNSRGPQTLFSLRPMIGCQVGSADEAAEFGEVVVIAVPLSAINALPVAGIKNKHVIDAVNYYPQRDGDIAELDSGQTTTSELLAHVKEDNAAATKAAIGRAQEAFLVWRDVPAPRRGELVRLLGEELRAAKPSACG